MNNAGAHCDGASPFRSIRAIDCTVVFVRDLSRMRTFYEEVLGFARPESFRRLGSSTASGKIHSRWHCLLSRPRTIPRQVAAHRFSSPSRWRRKWWINARQSYRIGEWS